MSFTQQIVRVAERLRRDTYRLAGIDSLTGTRIQSLGPMLRLGSKYGGWIIPADVLTPYSVCYLAGAGEDISFDLALAERFGSQIHTFDPTPRAISYVRSLTNTGGLTFHPVGLWDCDETLKFFAPSDPTHVSHSIVNLQGTSQYFEAPCRSLSSVMRDLKHTSIDLLKLDIEGAEHRVIASMLAEGVDVSILCVEFDEAVNTLTAQQSDGIMATVRTLQAHGYVLAAQEGRSNYTFVRL